MSVDPPPEASPPTPAVASDKGVRRKFWIRGLLLILIIAVIAAAHSSGIADELTLEKIVQRESQFRDFQQKHPVAVYGAAFLLYAAVTGISLPVAVPLSLAYGWFFGFLPAMAVVSFGSTAGATVAFAFSRYLLRDSIQARFGERLAGFNDALRREGAFYLFTLRLIPAVPFFVINVVMGLTPIRVLTFWIVSQIGMLPGTAVYVYAGASIPSADELAKQGLSGLLSPQLLVAFTLLGLFPIVVKKLINRFRPSSESHEESPTT